MIVSARKDQSSGDDQDNVAALVPGNLADYEQSFRMYYQELCRFCLSIVKNEDLAEELVQEVFIKLWEKKDSITIQSSLRSYLYTSVKNTAFNYLKSKQNKPMWDVADLLQEEAYDKSDTNINFQELFVLVKKGVLQLPEKCQQIFKLSRVKGMSYKQIAQELNISEKTVENQMGIALKKLREFIQPHWELVLLLVLPFLF